MKLSRLHTKVKKILKNNSFIISNEIINKDKIICVINFNNSLNKSTFYLNILNDDDEFIIGANITLNEKVITSSVLNRIRTISKKFHSSSFMPQDENDERIILIQNTYKYEKLKEKEFISHINNFQDCIYSIYNDIQKYANYQDNKYLDLSMFETADWSLFDPYKYIIERDKYFNGSWLKYIDFLKRKTDPNSNELVYVKMCKTFEDKNDIPIDLACDYIIDNIIQDIDDKKQCN